MERRGQDLNHESLEQPHQSPHKETHQHLVNILKDITVGLPLHPLIKQQMPCNQHQPQPNTILNRFPHTVHKIQHPFSQEEVPLNEEHSNSNNPIRHQSPTDQNQNHNLPFPQLELPQMLLPQKGNAEGGYQQPNDQNQTHPLQKNPEAEMGLGKLIRNILFQKRVVFLLITLFPQKPGNELTRFHDPPRSSVVFLWRVHQPGSRFRLQQRGFSLHGEVSLEGGV